MPLALAPTSLARLRRLKRLGRGEKELARSDFQMIPELAGNPFLPRIFEMWVLAARGWEGVVWNSSGRDAGAAPISGLPLPRGPSASRPCDAARPTVALLPAACAPSPRFDADGDGYMHAGDLRALLESLGRLARDEEERFQCELCWVGLAAAPLAGCADAAHGGWRQSSTAGCSHWRIGLCS